MNALQRLIRKRMADLDYTFRDVAAKGGLSFSTVSTLANKDVHRQIPRMATLEKLAKGLDVPLDVLRAAAVEAAGFRLQEITVPIDGADDARIVMAAMSKMSAADREKMRRLALAFQNEIDAEDEADEK